MNTFLSFAVSVIVAGVSLSERSVYFTSRGIFANPIRL